MSGRGRAARLRERLSDRDLLVLRDLARLRLVTGKQLRRLHFAAGDLTTQARKARATVGRLAELDLIVRLARRVGGMRAGSEGFVIGLSGWGHAVLALDSTAEPRRRRRVIETKPAFQSHVLAVSELYVQLVEASRVGLAELIDFAGEPEAWRRFGGIGGQAVVLKPDAFVRLGIGEFEVLAFIEQDMATESLPTIVRKCEVYIAHWRSGLEQRQLGAYPKVWWLVPSTHRRDSIQRVLKRLPGEARALFEICLTAEAVPLLAQPLAEGGAP